MSNERRHLRFLITSALLVGPAIGCGSAETESQTTPIEQMPTGNPMGPVDPSGELVEPTGEVTGEVVEPTDEVVEPEQVIGQLIGQGPVGVQVIEHPPTGNPVGPTPQPPVIVESTQDPIGNPAGPEPEVEPVEPVAPHGREPRPRPNIRFDPSRVRRPAPTE